MSIIINVVLSFCRFRLALRRANQVYSQGYYNELATFVEAARHHDRHVISTRETIKDTYRLMDNLQSGWITFRRGEAEPDC